MTDLRVLHRRALRVSVDVVDRVRPEQLGLPTPCAEWDLGQLLAHMTGQNHGFALAAGGAPTALGDFAPREVAADPAGLHAASAAELAAAFAAPGLLERRIWLPEIRPAAVPATTAVGFHLVDSVAHAWDVARALDVPVSFDDEVLDAALVIALAVPDGPVRERAGSAFRPGVAVSAAASAFDRILGLLGRSPQWSPDELGIAVPDGAVNQSSSLHRT
jgi:uncharacterized protein (TIGR03086 family)